MRSPLRLAAVMAAVTLLSAGCQSGPNSPVATAYPSPSETPTPPALTQTPSVAASSVPSRPASGRDAELANAFVELALNPGPATVAALLVAQDGIRLGLGPLLLKHLSVQALSTPASWQMNPRQGFRAYLGPFSALKSVRNHIERAGDPKWLRPSGRLQYLVGPHPHCASPPKPAPDGFETLRRISVQPAAASINSCLAWFTVDMFVNDQGNIAAITLDLWEP